MQINRIAHLHDDIAGQRAHALEQALGHGGAVARNHHDRRSFANGAADAENYTRHYAAFGRGQHHAEYTAFMTCPQCQRAFIIAGRNGIQRRFRYGDDGGQDHHAQQDAGRQQRGTRAAEDFAYQWHEHHQTEEAVYDRRNTGQQRYCRAHDPYGFLRGKAGHEDGGQYSGGNARNQCSGGNINGSQNEGQDAEDLIARLPFPAGQEIPHTNPCHAG